MAPLTLRPFRSHDQVWANYEYFIKAVMLPALCARYSRMVMPKRFLNTALAWFTLRCPLLEM